MTYSSTSSQHGVVIAPATAQTCKEGPSLPTEVWTGREAEAGMTECARAGLGQSCCIETGLRNPSLANGLCFPREHGLRGLSFYGCHAQVLL